MRLSVPDMSCGHCTAAIQKALAATLPGATVACDLSDRTVRVTGAAAPDAVLAALAGAGYPATVLDPA